jgi:EcsC protein family
MVSQLSSSDFADLQGAVAKLESQSLAMKITSTLGLPIEALLHRLPLPVQSAIETSVDKALEQCLRIAVKAKSSGGMHKRAHTAAAAFTGAVGGFFGLPGLLVELPVTTTVMLHSIVAIARSYGEDFSSPESGLACLEVFALGPSNTHGAATAATESAYYATRTALAQVTREAVSYVTQKGMAKEGAPALLSFVGRIASRFGLEVSEKVAAELVPIAGAVGGFTLNVVFSRHFQSLAEGHFLVRRLERHYGSEAVRQDYELARSLRGQG